MLLIYYGSPVSAKYSVISVVHKQLKKVLMLGHVRTSQGPQKHISAQRVKCITN